MTTTSGHSLSASADFIRVCRLLLTDDYMLKLRTIVNMFPEEDVWWRPNDISNSVGNMLLHIAGNLRQWIISGVGGEVDLRQRPLEFSEKGPIPKASLMENLEETVAEVDRVLANLSEDSLAHNLNVQGFDVSGLHAIYHSVEHFSYHLGQIAYVAKIRQGKDLGVTRLGSHRIGE